MLQLLMTINELIPARHAGTLAIMVDQAQMVGIISWAEWTKLQHYVDYINNMGLYNNLWNQLTTRT